MAPVTLREIAWAAALSLYVYLVVLLTKIPYRWLVSRGFSEHRAGYVSRKLIHMAGAGVATILVPCAFSTPLLPFAASMALALYLYYHHRSGRLMDWFQFRENMYEVNFAVAWGASMMAVWLLTGDIRISILPGLLIAFGDGVTGLARNLIVKRRSKHWIGNVFMLLVSAPLGYWLAGLTGLLAGAISSLVERFEYRDIDDNILIAAVSSLVLVLGFKAGLVTTLL